MYRYFDYIRFLIFFISLLGFQNLWCQETLDKNIPPTTKKSSGKEKLPLDTYLQKLEKSFDINFLYEASILEGKYASTSIVKEDRGIAFNLNKALKNNSLSFVRVSTYTYVIMVSQDPGYLYGRIQDKNGIPLVGAAIRITDHSKGAIANLKGNYKLDVPFGKQQIEISYVGHTPEFRLVEIEGNDTLKLNVVLSSRASLDEVVVVGSRFSVSPLLEKTEPADIVNGKRLTQGIQQKTAQLLHYTVPSFHSTIQTISDGTDHIDPATLRGMGPDQLLVLINGKRRHPSSLVNVNGTIGRGSVATDLNAIPTAAIDRIEVLRSGAATEYGSDAISGVINIVLKKNTSFLDMNVYSGISQEGDGLTYKASGNYGLPVGTKGGFLNLTGDFMSTDSYNRSGNFTGTIYGDDRDADPAKVEAFFDQTGYKDQRVMSVGSAKLTNTNLFGNLELPIGPKVKFYSFAGSNYRVGESLGFYRFPKQRRKQSGLYPLGFSPAIQTNIFDRSATIGVKAEKLPWQIDFSNSIGNNRFDYSVGNSNNASMGLESPSEAKAGGFTYTQNVTNIDVSREIKWEFPIYVELGSEFRLENYRIRAGEMASWYDGGDTTANGQAKEQGIQVFPGFRPENELDEYRHNIGAYGELEAKVTDEITLAAGGRYEYYSDFKSNFIWKIAGRYTYDNWLTFRGTYSTGFRAPSMPQVHFSSTTSQFVSVGNEQVSKDVGHFNNESPVTAQFGILPLEAETSGNLNFGVAANLFKRLGVMVDYYRIDVANRIVITGRFSENDDLQFQKILAPIGVSNAQFFTNAIDTKTDGVDLTLNYSFGVKKTKFKFSLVSNFTRTRLKRGADGEAIIRTSDFLEGFEDILFNREEISRIEVAQPQSKTILTGHFQAKKVSLFLAATRFGKVKYVHPGDENSEDWVLNTLTNKVETRDQVFSPKVVTDLSISYQLTNTVTFVVGGNNIFNVYPDKHTHSSNIGNGIFEYSRRVQQFGIRGAFWFGKVNVKF